MHPTNLFIQHAYEVKGGNSSTSTTSQGLVALCTHNETFNANMLYKILFFCNGLAAFLL